MDGRASGVGDPRCHRGHRLSEGGRDLRIKDYERQLLRAAEEAVAALLAEGETSGEGAVALLRRRREA
jgi:hypothetical protein